MRIIKRVSFFLIAILFGYTSVYPQTLADVKMGEILNNGDLFQIREQYPILKDSVSIEMLNQGAISDIKGFCQHRNVESCV